MTKCCVSDLLSFYFQLTAPDGNQMYGQEKKTDDSYFFTAEQEGKYVFCLANQKSSLVPKSVYFMFDFLNDEKRFDEGEGGQNKTGKNQWMSKYLCSSKLIPCRILIYLHAWPADPNPIPNHNLAWLLLEVLTVVFSEELLQLE